LEKKYQLFTQGHDHALNWGATFAAGARGLSFGVCQRNPQNQTSAGLEWCVASIMLPEFLSLPPKMKLNWLKGYFQRNEMSN